MSDFQTTCWTLVFTAGNGGESERFAALERLCQSYWHPAHAYIRRRGHSEDEALDLTQEFFSRLLALNWLQSADPHRGRFRTFLFTCLRNFVISSLRPPTPDWSPEEPDDPCLTFDREWALALLRAALSSVESSWAARSKSTEFNVLSQFLPGMSAGTPRTPASPADLSMSPEAFRKALSRLRAAVRTELRTLVAETVDPAEVDDELRYLFAVLENPGAEIR